MQTIRSQRLRLPVLSRAFTLRRSFAQIAIACKGLRLRSLTLGCARVCALCLNAMSRAGARVVACSQGPRVHTCFGTNVGNSGH
eukprot:1169044-Pleurochrysis_carterae.AAC.1